LSLIRSDNRMRIIQLLLITLISLNIKANVFNSSYQNQLQQQEFIDQMKAIGAKFSEADRAIMKKASAKIQAQLSNPGLTVGSIAPDFLLKDAQGHPVQLSQILKQGPVVLVFYRGAWCPYCNLHLKVLTESVDQFKQYQANLITVTPQTPDQSLEQFKADGFPFVVLSDLDYQVMHDYNLYFELPEELLAVYKKIGLDIEAFNGKNRKGLPVPATLVIDKQGIIRAQHAETDYTARMEPATIIEVLKDITGKN
jgi:peroxiredoxin